VPFGMACACLIGFGVLAALSAGTAFGSGPKLWNFLAPALCSHACQHCSPAYSAVVARLGLIEGMACVIATAAPKLNPEGVRDDVAGSIILFI
jgi:hypothetical protein